MTKGVRLRRMVRTRGGKRVAPRKKNTAAGGAPTRAVTRGGVQAVACALIFVVLVGLKLVLPGNLAAFRGTLAQWLVRDADFAAAFSAVGHAASAPQRFVESLGDAYVAVFGEREATEVMGSGELRDTEKVVLDLALPDSASSEQPELPFAFASPLDGTLTSAFGWREDPNSGNMAFHYGLDLAADEGTEIRCFAAGKVGVVGESTELGKYLSVLHPDGFETLYAHCSRISVSSGESVAMGDRLGEVGSTGNATGAHLHFEVHDGPRYIDPAAYLHAQS